MPDPELRYSIDVRTFLICPNFGPDIKFKMDFPANFRNIFKKELCERLQDVGANVDVDVGVCVRRTVYEFPRASPQMDVDICGCGCTRT